MNRHRERERERICTYEKNAADEAEEDDYMYNNYMLFTNVGLLLLLLLPSCVLS